MVPAAIASKIPGGPFFDPFTVYFFLEDKDFKNKGWIERLAKDKEVTGGIFQIKVYHKSTLFEGENGSYFRNVLEYSNVLARVINPSQSFIQIEHRNIFPDKKNIEDFKKELGLFILQICRSDLDEILNQIAYNENSYVGAEYSDKVLLPLRKLAKAFKQAVNNLTKTQDNSNLRRLRAGRQSSMELAPPPSRRRRRDEDNLSNGLLSFVSFKTIAERKYVELPISKLKKDEDGKLMMSTEDLRELLEEVSKAGRGFSDSSNLSQGKKGGAKDEFELVSNKNVKILVNNRNHNERFPRLTVEINGKTFDINTRNEAGIFIYINALIRTKLGRTYPRHELIKFFVDYNNFHTNNNRIEESDVRLMGIADGEEKIDLYCSIYELVGGGDMTFNDWCRQPNSDAMETVVKGGLNDFKRKLREEIKNVQRQDYEKILNIKTEKKNKRSYYYVDILPENIIFPDTKEWQEILDTTKELLNAVSINNIDMSHNPMLE